MISGKKVGVGGDHGSKQKIGYQKKEGKMGKR